MILLLATHMIKCGLYEYFTESTLVLHVTKLQSFDIYSSKETNGSMCKSAYAPPYLYNIHNLQKSDWIDLSDK